MSTWTTGSRYKINTELVSSRFRVYLNIIIGRAGEENIYYDIKFSKVSANQYPRIQESDESYSPIFPHEARLRNLTYSTEIYVNVQLIKLQEILPGQKSSNSGGLETVREIQEQERRFRILEEPEPIKVFLGKVPVMIRSKFCHLKSLSNQEITKNARECTFD